MITSRCPTLEARCVVNAPCAAIHRAPRIGTERPGAIHGAGAHVRREDLIGRLLPLYPAFQAFFRKYEPPTLIVWGKNDFIFPAEGAAPYRRDLKNVETYMLDTGHFALETHGEEIAGHIEEFMPRQHRKR